MSTQVKICGLTRREDAEAAAAAGAAWAGVVLAPGGRRSVTPEHAAGVLAGLALRRVGVFVDAPAAELRRAARLAGLDVLQLHGDETPEIARALREEGRWRVWKAVRPRSAAEFVEELDRFAGSVDALLLDGWSAAARGGTGAAFPWEEVAAELHRVPTGLALVAAGGLRPDNVARAVALLRPAIVDVSSGVERAPGIKDGERIQAFVEAALRQTLPTS